MNVRILSIGLLTAAGAASLSAPAWAQVSSIRVAADRTVLRADGKSNTFLVADVRDAAGQNVPDGTRVVFTLTSGQGRLESSVVETRNGVARVRFTAGDAVGSVIITVNLEPPLRATPDQITITLAREANAGDTGIQFVHVVGKDYLGYAADKQTLQANGKEGGAGISYRGVTLHADLLQVDVTNNSVLALGNVILKRGERQAKFSNLRYSLTGETGFGEREVDGKLRAVTLSGAELTEATAPLESSESWTPKDLSDSAALIKAKAVDIEPGTRLQFRRATLYLDGSKTVSLPFHVINLNGQPNFTDQILGYNAGGVTVDLPFYYDVRPSAIGTMYVRHGAPVGASAFSNRTGWSVDFDQSYRNGVQNNGVFQVFGLTRQNWGARYQHNQQLGNNTSGNVFLDFPNHRDLFGSSQVSRRFNGFNVNLSAVGSYRTFSDTLSNRSIRNSDLRWQLDADTFAKPIPGARFAQYSLNVNLSRQNYYGSSGTTSGAVNTQSLGLQAYTRPFNLGQHLSFTQSGNVAQTWIGNNTTSVNTNSLSNTTGQTGGIQTTEQTTQNNGRNSGITLVATSTLSQRWGQLGYGRLTYNFSQTPLTILGNSGTGRHRVGFEADISDNSLWGVGFYGSRSLDINQTSLAGTLRLNPTYAKGPWRTTIRTYLSQTARYRFVETEVAVVRRLFNRDIGLLYSTTARQFQLDLNAARF